MRLNWRKYLLGRIVIVLGLSILFVLFINNNNHKEINRKTKTSVVDSKSKSVENSQSEKRSSSSEGDRKSHQVTTAAEEKNIIELKKGIIMHNKNKASIIFLVEFQTVTFIFSIRF